MSARIWTLSLALLLLVSLTLRAAEAPVCGENDLVFGCTDTKEPKRLRAGCGVHDEKRFFASEWRIYDLRTEKLLKRIPAGPDGIALIEIPQDRWFIVEGELTCAASAGAGSGGVAIPYRFLFERTGKKGFVQRAYTPENLVATGNWNPDTQLNYGEFRSRSLNGSGISQAVPEN